jgi:branched-chain amino acid transport system permease protein
MQAMPKISRKAAIVIALWAVLVIVPQIFMAYGQTYYVTILTRIIILALVAVSLDLLIGYGGMVSFGHAAFFGLGGYVVGISSFHLAEGVPFLGWEGTNSALVAWPLAMLVASLAALVIGALSLRTSGVNFIMITLAFAQMLFYLFVALKYYGGDDGLSLRRRNTFPGVNLARPLELYYVCLAALAIAVGAMHVVLKSRFGMVIRAAKASERRMYALGFPVFRYQLVAFVIAGAIAGLGGALWVNLARFVSPEMLSWVKSGELMIMVILGGLGTLIGPVIGAAVLIVLETVLTGLTEHWAVILGPILIAIVLFVRGGLYGWLGGAR